MVKLFYVSFLALTFRFSEKMRSNNLEFDREVSIV